MNDSVNIIQLFNFYRSTNFGINMESSGNENDSGVMLEPSFDLRVDVSVKEVSLKRRHALRYFLRIMSNIFVFPKCNYKFKVKNQ